ncbi:hypothetical protein Leryth_017813 [Lithospermum erythrorhizon]|nr:hypothetical protein Leryth_017813 [Lithospermum erythrorhizon]
MESSRFDRKIGATYILPRLVEGSDEEKECMKIFDCISITNPDAEPYCFYEVFSSPNFTSLCPEFDKIRLPRSCPPGHRLPKNSIMPVFECSFMNRSSMVFAFDEANSQLYHIVTKKEDLRSPFVGRDAYVAVDDTLYYVGGCFGNHDVEHAFTEACEELSKTMYSHEDEFIATAKSMAEVENKKNLEVETYNFVTGKFEEKTKLTKLNSPKHLPIVFLFDNKIYALAGRKSYFNLGDNFESFEYLDISTPKTEEGGTWTRLPPPPFRILQDSRHILWKEKKWLFVKVSDKATKRLKVLLWKFDLESQKWYNNSTDPSNEYHDPESHEFLTRLADVPADHFKGCIVNDMLFHYEGDKDRPEVRQVVGYNLRRKKILGRRWEIDLKEVLGQVGDPLSLSFFSHVADDTFCIVVNYKPYPTWFVNFLCICLFDLKCGDDQMSLYESRACKLNELRFNVVRPRCHYFQMPNHVILAYQTML